MKFKVKTIIVLAVLVLVHVIFCLNTVSAVGRVSQSWIITEPSGERKLVFRTYTTPLDTTLNDYTDAVAIAPSTDLVTENGKTWTYIDTSGNVQNSKWIYNAPIEFPSDAQYGTARMIFHSKMFSNYDQYDSKGNWGYSLASEEISEDISSIANALANSEHIENIKPTVAETDLNKYIYYAITRISGKYSEVDWSTGLAMKYLKEKTVVEYRHAIINIGGTKNIYVADNIVQGEDLTNLIEALNGAEMCYVSEELITRSSYDENAYEVAVTATDFIKTYLSSSNNPKGKLWSRSSRGTENEGMGSVLNIYDNILKFPQTPKRKVYVRYINIGNQDTVNSTTVDYKKVEYIESLPSEKYINVGESQEKITTTKSTTAFGEYYDDIKITDLIKKTAIVRSDLIYLGHNVGVGTSLNHATNVVKDEVENGRYKIDTEVMVEGKSVYEDDDVVVIEFYYKEETPPPPPPEIEETDEPDKDISGNVFIESAEDIQTQCIDNKEGGYSIVSIPSGTRATVGIEKIPQYLLGAIDVENIGSNNNTFTFTYKFKAGPNEHSKTYTLNYDTAYYAVTNMLIYNFNGIEVYDADEDRDGTIGDSMFSWAKGVLTDNSLIKNPTVKMYGRNNVQIANSSSAITDFTNYFKGTILVGDAGGYVFKDKSINKNSHAIVKTYITESEFEKIDTNKDNIIAENDKTIANNNLQAKENESKQVTSELNKANSVLYTAITKLTTLNINDNAYKGLVMQYNSVKGTTSVYSVLDNLANLSIENAAYKEAASSYKEAKTNYASFQTKAAQVEQEYNEAKNINDYIIAHYDEVYAKYKEFVQMVHLTNSQAAQELNIRAKFEIANMQVTIDGEKLFTNEGTKTQTISFEDLSKTYKVEQDRPQIEDIEYKYKVNLFGKVGNTIKRNEYNNISLIDKSILNGVRALSGKVKYESQSVIGSATTVKDTAYYNGEKAFNVKENKELSKTYNVNLTAMTAQTKYEEVEPVNVYTPITVTTEVITDTNDILDQTETGVGASLIKLNTPFTIKIGNSISESNYNFENTERFNLGYYIKFDFDVHNVKVDGKSYKSGQKIEAGTWIGFLKGNNVKVTVEAYGSGETSTLSDGNGTYTVRALAYNASEHIRDTISLYPSLSHLLASSDSDLVENICIKPSYFAETTNSLVTLNRLYDFKVTDVKDIEWKTTFRTTTGSVVNKHTGNVYYSGITKWDTSSTNKDNNIINRPVSEIGRNPLRILPIGPYKNSDISKMNAPKLGYRFSFDFKVTGSYYSSNGNPNTEKTVNIKTKFYYISKDGNTFIEESNGGAGIYLFYKNSSGNYVKIDSNGGGYDLQFTPQDGYRYIEQSTNTLSTSLVKLGNLRNMTLRYNMATPNENRTVITYYGEYKLPNSTIAVKVDNNGKYDINNPLTNGYIGVVFDIYANTGSIKQNGVTKDIIIKYGKNTDGDNTSQWDYEGFLGFTNYGNKVKNGELAIRLQQGSWQLTDAIYNKIKGTVILYDMDERAATDFD